MLATKRQKLAKKEIVRYIEFVKYFEFHDHNKPQSIDRVMRQTRVMLPGRLRNELAKYTDGKEYSALIKKKLTNKKAYNAFCFAVLNILARRLEIETCYLNPNCFHTTFLSSRLNGQSSLVKDKTVKDHCAFILRTKTTNLIFSFGHQGTKNLHELSDHIVSIDKNAYKNIHIILFRNNKELHAARQANKANAYNRCFFTSFTEIGEKAIELDKESYEKIFSIRRNVGKTVRKLNNTASLYDVQIIDNIPVGKESFKLYKLAFKTDDPIDITPGQFVMISTSKEKDEFKPRMVNAMLKIKPAIHNDLQAKQRSYLKRPFGIYRTYERNFGHDFYSKLQLDKRLAAILYTAIPDSFEIVYKVLDKGVGTNELTRLVKGDHVKILAPLGKVFDFRELVKEELDEIHIVGGGVGIAPLVYLVQVLRVLNFRVKAFVGVEDIHTLVYKNANTKGYTGSVRDAKIYIDDLKMLGLSEASDIYVSLLCNTVEEKFNGIKNLFKGSLVTEPYAEYLKKHRHLRIQTFTCGPLPMMEKVHHIAAQYNIKAYVLMEKRMACGIGVCFSCVCRTLLNGKPQYSRVCIDGPIIESNQINWNE